MSIFFPLCNLCNSIKIIITVVEESFENDEFIILRNDLREPVVFA